MVHNQCECPSFPEGERELSSSYVKDKRGFKEEEEKKEARKRRRRRRMDSLNPCREVLEWTFCFSKGEKKERLQQNSDIAK